MKPEVAIHIETAVLCNEVNGWITSSEIRRPDCLFGFERENPGSPGQVVGPAAATHVIFLQANSVLWPSVDRTCTNKYANR
jgi:hypothetical protein